MQSLFMYDLTGHFMQDTAQADTDGGSSMQLSIVLFLASSSQRFVRKMADLTNYRVVPIVLRMICVTNGRTKKILEGFGAGPILRNFHR